MTPPSVPSIPPQAPLPPLDAIRRKEAEVKRRLAAEREAAQAALAEAEKHAGELMAAAEAQGRQDSGIQRQAARAEAEREAEALVAQARAYAERFQRLGTERMAQAVARALEIVIGEQS